MRVALAGAPGSGKSRLAVALTSTLNTSGWPAVVRLADPAVANHPHDNNELTLLMGLESSTEDAHAADQRVRTALAGTGSAYAVLYGSTEERLVQALGLIEKRLTGAGARTPAGSAHGGNSRPWTWVCDKCSDPQCEHRLLTDLLAKRLITAA